MSLPMKIMCINDANRPQKIPVHKWVKKNEIYTLVGVQNLLSSQSFGFVLDEIDLDESCFPYHYFNPDRFVPIDTIHEELLEEVNEILNPVIA